MKKFIFITLFVSFFVTALKAQIFTRNSGSSDYSVLLPTDASPWLTPNDGSRTPVPIAGTKKSAATVFIEFGDGTFSFLPNGNHTFVSPGKNREVTTKATGVYGGGGKPPSYAVGTVEAPASTGYTPMNVLQQSGTDLAITPNIGDVVATDTMIFVITYRTLHAGASLLFLFNDNNTYPIFKNISLGDKLDFPQKPLFVRTYSTENEISISNAGDGLTSRRNANGEYSGCVAFEGINNDGDEHNIFVTLIPKDNLLTTDLSVTTVKAVLVWDDTSGLSNKGSNIVPAITTNYSENSITLPISGDNAHDPNYVTVKPNCMLLPKTGKELKYHVHFQNTGMGDASKVRVAVKVPDGTNFTNDIDINSYKFQIDNGSIISNYPYANSSLDSLLFEFEPNNIAPGCTLEGLDMTTTNLCNKKTMGDFWFTIKTTSQMPDILLTQASIVFYNPINSPIPVNDPILTNTAVSQFRECCECNKSCDPCKRKKGLWKWLFCKKC
jgi:hypothetical protein